MYTGKGGEFAQLRRGNVYQVTAKEPAPTTTSFARNVYRLRVAFDFDNPVGTAMDTVSYSGTRELKRIGLLDLCTLRLHFDAFIRQWAQQMGHPGPDEVR